MSSRNQRQLPYRNQSSAIEPNSSSNNSSKTPRLVTVTRRLGKPKETVRDVKRGSATDLEPIGSAMIVGLTREPRKSRSYSRRRSGSLSVSYASSARRNSSVDEPAPA